MLQLSTRRLFTPSTRPARMSELSIGQFSRVSRLSVRTLRHYHRLGLLEPARVDGDSGYRYYRAEQLERAQVILSLKQLGFGLETIAEILGACARDEDMVEVLESQRQRIEQELGALEARRDQLDALLSMARENAVLREQPGPPVSERELPEVHYLSRRVQAGFDQMGSLFKSVARVAGRHIAGPGMALFYDQEYREVADFEAGFPVRRPLEAPGFSCRSLPAMRAIVVTHVGPYNQIHSAWTRAFAELGARGLEGAGEWPPREIYIKGPGIIFKGNPKRYVTEVCVGMA